VPALEDLLQEARGLLFIGVGNVLKRDDGVGVVISRQIVERAGVRALTVEVSIENYIGKINSLEPSEIVIVDCMELGCEAGTYKLLKLKDIEDFTFNTHNISLSRLGDFFQYPTYVLGIQPESVAFGEKLSPPVRNSARQIICLINQQNS
jgi:hydrogenase 3 maturation protease